MTGGLSGTTRYRPGGWTAVVGPDCVLLTDLAPDGGLVRRCWDLAGAGAGPTALIAAIAHEGLREIRSFAVVGAQQVFVRGDAEVDIVDGAGERHTVTGVDALTWTEHHVSLSSAVVRGGVTDGAELPIKLGVVLAAELVLGVTEVRSEPVAVASEADMPQLPPPQEVVEQQERDYDHLFRYTMAPVSEPVAQQQMSPETLAPVHTEVTVLAAPSPPSPASPPAAPVPSAASTAQFEVITDLPWAAPVDPAWVEPIRPTAPQDVSATILRPRGEASSAPMVMSVRCPARHQTPAGVPTCRVCGAVVPAQEPVSEPRPSLGVLHLSSGDTFPLDRDVVLGRNPRADGRSALRLDNGRGDISSNHVEVKLEGWDVIAVDLNSTNGTTVTTAAGVRTELPRGGARALEPGTQVNLADDTWFRFEVSR